MHYNTPSKIQETALPTLLADPYVFCSHIIVCWALLLSSAADNKPYISDILIDSWYLNFVADGDSVVF